MEDPGGGVEHTNAKASPSGHELHGERVGNSTISEIHDDLVAVDRVCCGRHLTNEHLPISGCNTPLSKQVRVSARTLAGYGVPSREALLRTRVSPPSAPPQAANMVSATPNSITVGWVPPKYENGKCFGEQRELTASLSYF